MKRNNFLYLITFVLAFCSMAYELILAQSLSAFLDNTVLRYSVTIGLYMFSMGMGAFLIDGRTDRHPIITLLRVEIFLTLLGGFSVIYLFLAQMAISTNILFIVLAHSLIIFIGILTGFEIPLLIEIANKENQNSENQILGVNYLGALFGTVIFAFIFYPRLGLIPSVFLVGLLNAVSGMALFLKEEWVESSMKKQFYGALYIQLAVLCLIAISFMYGDKINVYFINHYLT